MVYSQPIDFKRIHPPIWYFLKYAKHISLPLLFTACFLSIWIPFPGFSAASTLFFSIGAWCSIHHFSLFAICQKLFIPSVILTPIAISLMFFGCIPLTLFNIIAIPLFLYCMWLLCKDGQRAPSIVATSPMFLYLTHCYIVENQKVWEIVHKILPKTYIGELCSYFLVPIVAIGIIILLHWLLRKIAPRMMLIICGR